MKIEVVIGANYGDEGKGLFTAYLCKSKPKPLVVMSNGGCQRGHTVNDKKFGIRHIFHHFGSGTLSGVPTVFSKTFLLNPIKFIEEKLELENYGIKPLSWRAPGCILQLPGDMLANQLLEMHRSKDGTKHGSCGWGIWETIVRNARFKKLLFDDFAALDCSNKIKCIKDSIEWQLECRIKKHNVLLDDEMSKMLKLASSDGFIAHFIDDFNAMACSCKALSSNDLLEVDYAKHCLDVETLVVENAQGLLLDKRYAPEDENGRRDIHSTPSKTGLDGALDAVGKISSIDDITANYISRTYMTRHGAGPFPEMTPRMKHDDMTNMPNAYQDAMRFGKMTYEAARSLLERISLDAKDMQKKLVLTHLNEERCLLLEENADYMSYEDDFQAIKPRLRLV